MGKLRLGNVAQGLQDLLQRLGLSRDSPAPDKPKPGLSCDRAVLASQHFCVLCHTGEGTVRCLWSLGEPGFTSFINQTDFPRNLLSVMTNYMLHHINGRVVVSPALLSVVRVGCFQEQGTELWWSELFLALQGNVPFLQWD